MNAVVQSVLRLIYPPRCLCCNGLVDSDFGLCGSCWRDTPFAGGTVCNLCGIPLPGGGRDEVAHCDECMGGRPWVQGREALVYSGNARKLVLAFKHGDRHDIAAPAAAWMAQAGGAMIRPGMIVAAVPLHWRRRLKQRFNQSALLARELARHRTGLTCLPDLLLRPHAKPVLDGLSRDDRFGALHKNIVVNSRHMARLRGRPVLIVDDVMTTGATFSAATEACLAAGSGPVAVLALARVAKDP